MGNNDTLGFVDGDRVRVVDVALGGALDFLFERESGRLEGSAVDGIAEEAVVARDETVEEAR